MQPWFEQGIFLAVTFFDGTTWRTLWNISAPDDPQKNNQFLNDLADAALRAQPYVILGDFNNSLEWGTYYKLLDALGEEAFTFQRAQSKTKIDDILVHKDARMEFGPPTTFFPFENGHAILSSRLIWEAEAHCFLQIKLDAQINLLIRLLSLLGFEFWAKPQSTDSFTIASHNQNSGR